MRRSDIVSVTRIHRNTIRKVNVRDYSAKAIVAWSGRISAEWLRTHYDSEQRFVAVCDDKIVGFLNMSLDSTIMQALYIRQGYIGRGIGSALFAKAEQMIRASGAKSMTVDSSLTARPFYERHGLQAIRSSAVKLSGVPVPSVVMRKRF